MKVIFNTRVVPKLHYSVEPVHSVLMLMMLLIPVYLLGCIYPYMCHLCISKNGSWLMPCVTCTCVKPLCLVIPIPSLRLCLGLPGHLCPAVSQTRAPASVRSHGVSCPKWDKCSTENVQTHQKREKLVLKPGHTFSLCCSCMKISHSECFYTA